MPDADRRCGTCCYYGDCGCDAPIPTTDTLAAIWDEPLPDSFTVKRAYVASYHGTCCPCWEPSEVAE